MTQSRLVHRTLGNGELHPENATVCLRNQGLEVRVLSVRFAGKDLRRLELWSFSVPFCTASLTKLLCRSVWLNETRTYSYLEVRAFSGGP